MLDLAAKRDDTWSGGNRPTRYGFPTFLRWKELPINPPKVTTRDPPINQVLMGAALSTAVKVSVNPSTFLGNHEKNRRPCRPLWRANGTITDLSDRHIDAGIRLRQPLIQTKNQPRSEKPIENDLKRKPWASPKRREQWEIHLGPAESPEDGECPHGEVSRSEKEGALRCNPNQTHFSYFRLNKIIIEWAQQSIIHHPSPALYGNAVSEYNWKLNNASPRWSCLL